MYSRELLGPLDQKLFSSIGTAERRWIFAYFVLGIAAVVAVTIALYQQSINLFQARIWVFHTHEVLSEIAACSSALKDVELYTRGFVITGEERYLADYHVEQQTAEEKLTRIRKLTQDNTLQTTRGERLQALVDSLLTQLDSTVKQRTTNGFDSAAGVVRSNRAQRLIEETRNLFRSMNEEERRLLSVRNARLNRHTSEFLVTFICAGLVAVIMFSASGYFIKRYVDALRRAQNEVEEQRKLFFNVLSSVSEGVMVADKSGKLLISNPAVRRILGVDPAESPEAWVQHYGLFMADGKTPYEFDNLPLTRARRGEEVPETEVVIRNKGLASDVCLSVSGRPLEKGAGTEGGVIVFRDISERKEAQLRLSEFYAMLSHELRTPMTSIRGSLDLIQGGVVGEVPAKIGNLLEIARRETERMLRLINDLLDLKKIESGEMRFKFTSVNPQELVNKAISALSGFAHDAGVKVVTTSSTAANVQCDEDRIMQVIANLLSNAIKFSPKGSQVCLSVDTLESNVIKFSVSDCGPGIEKEDLEKLFVKFQQGKAQSKFKGTGLGLPISKSIVEGHKGKIGIESEVGKGSTFYFTLPVSQSA